MPSETSLPPPTYKVVVLGESSVGKSSIVKRFTNNTFDIHTSNTIGAAFITKEYISKSNPNRSIKYEIWDTAGQERYRSLTPMYYRNSKVVLICFDLNNFEYTLNTAKYWLQQLKLNRNNDDNDRIEIRLIGTKLDLIDDKNLEIDKKINEFIKDEELEDNQYNIKKFHKTSSKDNVGINELFDDILDDIDEEFFKKYYEKLQNEPNDQIGSMLNARKANASNCC
ncbi:unnamed protein product [Candida verbasci]|uniref:Uncharacterized protein n=1 Tax=Candida verbasci TaxID=1227364 RepID=A0A9W4XD42_9ASCO|nr:unnamed protein product [Candida verbasci]